jgi:hypothetical protein
VSTGRVNLSHWGHYGCQIFDDLTHASCERLTIRSPRGNRGLQIGVAGFSDPRDKKIIANLSAAREPFRESQLNCHADPPSNTSTFREFPKRRNDFPAALAGPECSGTADDCGRAWVQIFTLTFPPAHSGRTPSELIFPFTISLPRFIIVINTRRVDVWVVLG